MFLAFDTEIVTGGMIFFENQCAAALLFSTGQITYPAVPF